MISTHRGEKRLTRIVIHFDDTNVTRTYTLDENRKLSEPLSRRRRRRIPRSSLPDASPTADFSSAGDIVQIGNEAQLWSSLFADPFGGNGPHLDDFLNVITARSDIETVPESAQSMPA
jgi:hypothetical protein